MLHDEGSDRVGHAHDAQERYGGAQLLVGVDEVEGLLCAPLHPKTEKEGEEGQHSCVHHLEWGKTKYSAKCENQDEEWKIDPKLLTQPNSCVKGNFCFDFSTST